MDLSDEVYCVINCIEDLQTLLYCLLVNKWWQEHTKNKLLVLPFKDLLGKETCVQSALVECLFITPRIAQTYPYSVKRRYGGGYYNVFPLPKTIHEILNDCGGFRGMLERKRKRDTRSKSAIESKCHARQERCNQISNALAKVGCTLRQDSHICREFIENGRGCINEIADKMAFLRWLHEYTDYKNKLEFEIQTQDDKYGFYPGISLVCAQEVQGLYHPPSQWPWRQ
jgi:hypothetical protein